MLKTCLLYTIYIKIYLWIYFKEDEGGSEEDVCPIKMYTLLFLFCIPYLLMFLRTSICCLFPYIRLQMFYAYDSHQDINLL